LVAVLIGCVDPLTANQTNGPQWEVQNVNAYAKTVAGTPARDIVYGWGLLLEGDTARWYECSAVDACGGIERRRPKGDLLAMETVGHATVDGGVVDVVKLTLAPGRTYVVPYTNPVKVR
jgi:hypothetical protein